MFGQFAPFYGQMGEDVRQQNLFGFQGRQNALDRANQIRLANIQANAARGGGGGDLSFEQRRMLQNEAIAGNLAAQMALGGGQEQQRQPNWWETGAATIAGQIPNIIMGR
jgi:hypothetical protein